MTSIDLGHLRSLVAIAECGGFGKAAAVLHISQPALSQHIRLLERDVGLKLFDKHGRGMRLTADGERTLVEARRLLAAHDEALDRLRGQREPVLAIGSTEYSAEQVLPHMLEALRQAFPNVRIRFKVARSNALQEDVDRGRLDLAFVLNAGDRPFGRAVAELPLSWYASPRWTPPRDDAPWSLVAFEEPCGLRRRAVLAFESSGREVDVALQSTTLDGVLAGARANLGVALLPTIGGAPAGLRLRADLPPAGHATVALVSREGLDPEIERIAGGAGEAFLAEQPHLRLLAASA